MYKRLAVVVTLVTACPAHYVVDMGDSGGEATGATGPQTPPEDTSATTPTTGATTTGEPTPTTGATTGETTMTTTGESTTGMTTGEATDATSTTDGSTGSTGPGPGQCPDPNSFEKDGECFCNVDYSWCNPDDPGDLTCCLDAPETTSDSGSSGSTG
jgi:hypothetical protein